MAGLLDRFVELGAAAQSEIDRVARLDVGRVPMGAIADRDDRRLGGTQELADLGVGQLGEGAQQPGHPVGLVLAFGDRGITSTLGALHRQGDVRLRQFEPRLWVLDAALDLRGGQLIVGNRVQPGHAGNDVAVGDRLHLERMQSAKLGDLIESQDRIFNKPHSGGFGHHW